MTKVNTSCAQYSAFLHSRCPNQWCLFYGNVYVLLMMYKHSTGICMLDDVNDTTAKIMQSYEQVMILHT